MQKIPVFKTFGNMVDSIIENLGAAFSMSWAWLLVLFPIRLAGDLFLLFEGVSKSKPLPGELWTLLGVSGFVGILTAITFASIAVNWHRFILRNEVAEGWQRLRLDGLVWHYFLFVIVIALLVGGIVFGGYFAGMLMGFALNYASNVLGLFAAVIFGIAAIPLALLVFGISARWSVKLVAIAMGNKDYSLSDAWRATTGNTWRLSGLYLLFIIALALISLVIFGLQYFVNIANSSLAAAATAGIEILVGWFSTLMGITMLTSIYAFFVEKKVF